MYWLNVKILTFSVCVVSYIEVKRNILILYHEVLKPTTTYKTIRYNIFKGRFLT